MARDKKVLDVPPSHAGRIIKGRLDELGRNPFEAARIGGLPRTFIYEMINGKKLSFRQESMWQVAKALDWTEDELSQRLSILTREPSTEILTYISNGFRRSNDRHGSSTVESANSASSEAAFVGLARILRPDLSGNIPDLLKLFRDLAAMPADGRISLPLADQMYLRAQLLARRFAPK
jgi:predicted transcriptional regulator